MLFLFVDEKFAEESFLYKNFLLVFVSTLHRYKYYFAWILGKSNNAFMKLYHGESLLKVIYMYGHVAHILSA